MTALPLSRLGSTALSISAIGLAIRADGDTTSPHARGRSDARDPSRPLREGLRHGLNWIALAPENGPEPSETIAGRLLAGLPEVQRPYVFARGGVPAGDAHDDGATTGTLRPEAIRAQCEQTVRRLGLDAIDVYELQGPGATDVPIEESWGELCDLVDEGKVRYPGLCGFSTHHMQRCEAVRHVDVVEDVLSPDDRIAGAAILQWCRAHDTGFVARGVDATRAASDAAVGTHLSARQAALSWAGSPTAETRALSRGVVRRVIDRIAGRHASAPMSVVAAWTLTWPGVTAMTVDAPTGADVRDAVAGARLSLGPDDLTELRMAMATIGSLFEPLGPEVTVPRSLQHA